MTRLLIILALLIVLYLILRLVVREFWGRSRKGDDPALIDRNQMLQDPVCRAYVPRESAVSARVGGQTYYFCSKNCADTFQKQLSS